MDNLPPDPLVNTSIPLTTACARIYNWRKAFGNVPPSADWIIDPLMLPRAAFIPMADIKALADKYEHLYHMKVVGVRAYFGLEHPKFEGHVRFVMVPVVEVHDPNEGIVYYRDLVVEHHRISPLAADETSIYDFTKPCPDFCDTTSVLYNS